MFSNDHWFALDWCYLFRNDLFLYTDNLLTHKEHQKVQDFALCTHILTNQTCAKQLHVLGLSKTQRVEGERNSTLFLKRHTSRITQRSFECYYGDKIKVLRKHRRKAIQPRGRRKAKKHDLESQQNIFFKVQHLHETLSPFQITETKKR